MTVQDALGRGARWAPVALAAVILVSMLIGGQISGFQGAVATLLVLGGFASSVFSPRIAMLTALAGGLLASATNPDYSWWLLVVASAAITVAAFGIEPLLLRLLSGVPVAIAAGIASSIYAQVAWSPYVYEQSPNGVGTWLSAMLLWGAAVGARALRDALHAESAKQQAVARTTVVESELRDERLRADVTHDFHDVMAHSLAVLAAQAEGLRLSHKHHPERIDPVLTTISDTARLALVEVRQLLERVDDDARRPQATSADIPGLVAQLRSAGPTVTLLDVGAHGHLSRLGDIAAYRIVQESLTNALRHGGGDIDILVSLTWTGPGLTFAVSSPIVDRAALQPAGRGIAGMHERARVAGGLLEIDADGNRFVVSGYLPYEPISDAPTAPLTEEQLFTLPVPKQQRPEDIVAPWIVEATRLYEQRHPRTASTRQADPQQNDAQPNDAQLNDAQPNDAQPTAPYPTHAWSQATTVDLTPARLPGGRIRNPMAPDETPT